jgi:hypothetical protein
MNIELTVKRTAINVFILGIASVLLGIGLIGHQMATAKRFKAIEERLSNEHR